MPWMSRKIKQTAIRIFNGHMGGAQLVELTSRFLVDT